MTINGPTLHKGQQRVVELIKGPAKHVTVVAPRQVGKTFLGMQCLLYWAINWPNSTIYFCSPTYQQAKKVMEELHKAIADSGIVEQYHLSDFFIRLKNGSTIYFKSTERVDNLRGATADFMIVDEAAYHQEEAWTAVLRPIMLVRGKKVLFISTPRGNNWFKRMYDLGQLPDEQDYASCRMHYTENPRLNQSELEEARRTLPDHVFRAEYEGSFTDSGQAVFTMPSESLRSWPPAQGKIYCGIDLGKSNDFTVATFMDSQGRVVHVYRDNKKDWSMMVSEMLQLIRKYNATVMIEVNSIGDVVYEQVKKQWQDTHPFVTSNKSKADIIEHLAVSINDGSVTIPSETLFTPMWFELSVYEYNYSPKSRTLTYNAPAPFHDDCVMSLAIANWCKKTQHSVGSYHYRSR